MSPNNRPGAPPPHLANPSQLQLLQERVQQKYGAFGARAAGEDTERRILADDFLRPTLRIMGGVLVASILLYFLSHPSFDGPGNWANSFRLDSAFVVLWGPVLYWLMARRPLERSLRIYLVLGLFIESFSEAMFRELGDGYWDTVMWPAAVAYFGTIKEFAGVPGASLSVFTLVTAGLLYRAVWRKNKPVEWQPPPPFARRALLVFLGTVVGLALLGVLRGGAIEPTFRQTVHLLQLPLVGLLFLYALRIPEDLGALGTAFIVTAVARSLLVIFVYFGVCMPQGITDIPGKPEWCTNHSDSVLFVTSLMILLSHALEQRSSKAITRALGLGALILLAIVLNNRRLAFVSLSAAPLAIYLALKPSPRKRKVTAVLAVLVPLVVVYVLVGADMPGSSAIFKPAKLVVSVLDQKDTSSLSRDIENENLIYTLRQNPLLAQGFGHEYEFSPNNPPVDLGDLFKSYRYIAHNGVLWIWSLAGVVGFTLLWLIYPLAGTLAVRSYRGASTPLERSAALAALGAVVVCVIQIWGDQGFSSYMTLFVFGIAFAVASRLAVRAAAS